MPIKLAGRPVGPPRETTKARSVAPPVQIHEPAAVVIQEPKPKAPPVSEVAAVRRHARLHAGLIGDIDDPAPERGRTHIALDIVAADHVEDHVHAAPTGRCLHRLDEVLFLVVDRLTAQRCDGGTFLRARRRREGLHR